MFQGFSQASLADWVEAVATTVGALAAVIGLYAVYRQLRSDHERSRREKATDLVLDWTQTYTPEMPRARALAESLTKDQARRLMRSQPFDVPIDAEDLVAGSLPGVDPNTLDKDAAKGVIHISAKQVVVIRAQVLKYLNLLESILVAWYAGVADQQIIAAQFRYIVKPPDRDWVLAEVRAVNGEGMGWPAIHHFCRYIAGVIEGTIPEPRPEVFGSARRPLAATSVLDAMYRSLFPGN